MLRKAESSEASSPRAASSSLGPAGGPEGPGPGATPSPSPRSPVGPTTRGARSIPPARAQGTEGRAARGGRGVGQQPPPPSRSLCPKARAKATRPLPEHGARATTRDNSRQRAWQRAPPPSTEHRRFCFRSLRHQSPRSCRGPRGAHGGAHVGSSLFSFSRAAAAPYPSAWGAPGGPCGREGGGQRRAQAGLGGVAPPAPLGWAGGGPRRGRRHGYGWVPELLRLGAGSAADVPTEEAPEHDGDRHDVDPRRLRPHRRALATYSERGRRRI